METFARYGWLHTRAERSAVTASDLRALDPAEVPLAAKTRMILPTSSPRPVAHPPSRSLPVHPTSLHSLAHLNRPQPPAPLRDQWRAVRSTLAYLDTELRVAPAPKPTARMSRLLLAAEDHRFHRHPGVDPLALIRAAWRTYCRHSRQGGSTIAMQLVRTITGRRDATWKRKAVEMFLATRATSYLPRQRLPPLYLWIAYYGWNMHSFVEACEALGLDPSTSTLMQDAQLVARLKYPQPRYGTVSQQRRIRARAVHIVATAHRRQLL